MATCAQCLHENAAGASSCDQCGADLLEVLSLQLGEVCRRCDSYNDPGVRICISCGKSLSSSGEPAVAAEAVTSESPEYREPRSEPTPTPAPVPQPWLEPPATSRPAPVAASTASAAEVPAAVPAIPAAPPALSRLHEAPPPGLSPAPPLPPGALVPPSAMLTPLPMAPPPTPPPGWMGAPRPQGQRGHAVGSILCGRCRGQNPPTARFCGECGNPLVAAGAAPRSRARLIVIRGNGEGKQVPLLGPPIAAGRGEGALSFPDDAYLASLHATFRFQGQQLLVRDEGGTNGVYVRLRQAQTLRAGDMFVVGERVLRFGGLQRVPEANPARFGAPRNTERFLMLEEVLEGGGVGRVCRRAGPILTIGRGGCDLNFPNDGFVSARHAELSIAGETVFLRDLGSANGTYLRIQPRSERTLVHGDYVVFGKELIRVELAA